ncbi:MAG: nuclear transport factor 2 family protein [Deltaproteobacteria bacterium]|nr:nuclear transport factor 2 family protein [Deltaproteobacteria bacterium]
MTVFTLVAASLLGCTSPQPAGCPALPVPVPVPVDRAGAVVAIGKLLDQWHAAAGRADEEAYFAGLSEDSIFLGTDATERWDKPAFRAFAHPHFAKGKAWSFRAVRRDVILSDDGTSGWFDEDLATPNLGPARGSGVVVQRDGQWLIAHYNLAITVPNERFDAVKALLESPPSAPASAPPGEAVEPSE